MPAGRRPTYKNKLPCTPEQRLCQQEGFGPAYQIPPDLFEQIRQCGLECTGPMADTAKKLGRCGMIGAVMDRGSDLATPKERDNFEQTGVYRIINIVEAGTLAMHRVFVEGVDPKTILLNNAE